VKCIVDALKAGIPWMLIMYEKELQKGLIKLRDIQAKRLLEGAGEGSSRLRVFLFSTGDYGLVLFLEIGDHMNFEKQYVHAVNVEEGVMNTKRCPSSSLCACNTLIEKHNLNIDTFCEKLLGKGPTTCLSIVPSENIVSINNNQSYIQPNL